MDYIATALSFLLSFAFVPVIIFLCNKYSIYDSIDARKIHKGNIPRLGGIALFLSFTITAILFSVLYMPGKMLEYWPVFAGGAIILLAGIVDDLMDLPAKLKFVIQALAALIVALSKYNFIQLFGWGIPVVLAKILTFFWILSLVNAYNLIDGMDWICSGLSFLTILSISVVLRLENCSFYVIGFILCGAILGFMIWNKPPAKIFLGDGGSQTLGFVIAVLPIVSNKNPDVGFSKILAVVLLTSIPTTDVLAAVWRRLRDHKRIFDADRAHIHHKLLNIGFSKNTAIFFILLLQLFVCISIFLAYASGKVVGTFIMVFMYLVIESIFIMFHYLNRSVNIRNRGKLNSPEQTQNVESDTQPKEEK